MGKITNYPLVSSASEDDVILLDGEEGTRIIKEKDLRDLICEQIHSVILPIGIISPYGGAEAPDKWLLCHGQEVSRIYYAELFEVIGTSFGAGDGSTTFKIPDLRGEFVRGAGTNSRSGCGSGGNVGEHQAPTQHINLQTHMTSNDQWIGAPTVNSQGSNTFDTNSANVTRYIFGQGVSKYASGAIPAFFTSRPTNTSVNYIIKAMK